MKPTLGERRAGVKTGTGRRGKRKVLPEPPQELTQAQAEVWRAVVASSAGREIKSEVFPILLEYCRWTCAAREVSAQLAGVQPDWWRAKQGLALIERLRKLHEQATRMVNSCAVKLRLSPSAQEPVVQAKPAKELKLGKKDERQAAAQTAAKGRFAPPAPPRFAVVNGGKKAA